jgi:hypothetical protein
MQHMASATKTVSDALPTNVATRFTSTMAYEKTNLHILLAPEPLFLALGAGERRQDVEDRCTRQAQERNPLGHDTVHQYVLEVCWHLYTPLHAPLLFHVEAGYDSIDASWVVLATCDDTH